MILELYEAGQPVPLAWSDTNYDPSYGGTSPQILHSINGWYSSSIDISTENKIFTGGDIVSKASRKGKEITAIISVRHPVLPPFGSDMLTSYDFTQQANQSWEEIRLTFEATDRGRDAGSWEAYDDPVMTGYELTDLGEDFFVMEMTFFLPGMRRIG